jgi:DNA polymerase III alpha subunit
MPCIAASAAPFVPEIALPKGFDSRSAYLASLVEAGMKKRYPGGDEAAKKRAAYEIDVIAKTGNTDYFLYVADYVSFARKNGIRTGPGCGAGPSSLAAYCLGITDVDPEKYALVFDRFINLERNNPAEFTVEFSDDWRSKVLKYVRQKYGDACAKEWDLENAGLPVLDAISRTEELVRKKGKEFRAFSVDAASTRNSETFDLFSEGNTDGVYQFESDAIKKNCIEAKPSCIADLAAIFALTHAQDFHFYEYTDRKSGEHPVVYPAARVKEILSETYGMVIYQEQIILLLQKVCAYTPARADVIRQTLRKNNPEELAAEQERFMQNAVEHGYSEIAAKSILDDIVKAAPYAFLKSHAVASAVLAYRTGYLKANFPAEYAYE